MHKTSNNAAIISLLNSAPAAMTNTPVMNATVLNTAINSQQNTTQDATPIQTTSHQTILPKPILNPQQAAALQQQLQQQVSFFLYFSDIRVGLF